MSQYITSYLIDPVVRQARRFSRPSFSESSNQDVVQSSPLEFPNYEDPFDPAHHRASQRLSPLHSSIAPQADNEQSSNRQPSRGSQDNNPSEASQAQNDIRSRADTDPLSQLRHRSIAREQFVTANASFPSSVNEAGMRYIEGSSRSGRSSLTQGSLSPRGSIIDKELPEDDGMGPTRRKILEIQRLDASNAEKSRLMHSVMMERYSQSPRLSNLRPHSPSSLRSHERPFTPESNDPMLTDSPNTALSAEDELYATEVEKDATFYKPPPDSKKASDKDSIDEPGFGCQHYKRNVKLQCSLCRRWYTCRFCHDLKEDHCLNRRATKNMLCMACGCAQPASQDCQSCGQLAAWYFCKICKLWDDDTSKSIYHCDGCGICRRGQGLGKDFFHCEKCCACISMQIRDAHRCIERSTDCDCPICGEYMFSSPKTVVFMRCGHSIHHACWKEHMQSSFKCPICSKSMINMEITFRQYDLDIEAQPMPPQFQDTKAWIYCNDCSAKSLVKYHWIGLKCGVCDSYNTARLQIVRGPDNTAQPREALDSLMAENLRSSIRGRPASILNQSRAASTSAVGSDRRPMQPSRNARSSSPPFAARSVLLQQNESEDLDEMETSEEEVDFWGGEIPRQRISSGPESTSGDSSDSDDDGPINEMTEDEEDEEDQMEIFGHR